MNGQAGQSAAPHLRNYYQICTKTVMDTSDPNVVFDENGVSNHWHEYNAIAQRTLPYLRGDTGALERTVERIKAAGKGKPYDCLLGVSGGVDSTFLALRAKQLGLRVLAVHFDNGWNSELAVRNIERTINTVGMELHTLVVDWDEFRDLQRSYFAAGVLNLEVPTDHAIVATMFRLANKFGIKFMLSGHNHVTEGILPPAWVFDALDSKNIMAIQKRFGTRPLKTYPLLTLKDFAYLTIGKQIESVRLLNLEPFDKRVAMQTIQDELGWEYYGGKHYESIFTRFYQAYILPQKFGYDKRRAHYSTLICSGQISRDEALAALQAPTAPTQMMEEDRQYVIGKLGMTNDEFDAYMKAPVHNHLEYPNNQEMLAKARKIKARLNQNRRMFNIWGN
jgi:N-acetyl sugar amidotransferase